MKINKVLQTLICLILIAGCTSVATPTPTLPASPRPSTATPEPIVPPTPTRTRLPWRLPTPTEAEEQTPTSALPTRIPETNYLRAGQPLPDNLAVIGPENAARLSLLAVWGKGAILDLKYSPDGSRIAVLTGLGLYIYDAASYDLIEFREMYIPGGSWISPDLKYIVAKDINTKHAWVLSIWSAENGQKIQEWESVDGLALDEYGDFQVWGFSGQGGLLVSLAYGQNHAKTFIYDLASNIWTETGINEELTDFVISANGATAAAGISSGNDKFAIWKPGQQDDPTVHFLVSDGIENFDYVNPIAISPDGSLLALGEAWGLRVLVYRTTDLKLLYVINTPEPSARAHGLAAPAQRSGPGRWVISSVTFSPDGKRLAALNGFGTLVQYDALNGDPIAYSSIVARPEPGWSGGGVVQYSPDGKTIALHRFTASFLDITRNNWEYTLPDHSGGISTLDFSPDGRAIAYAGYDFLVWTRSMKDGVLQKVYAGHTEPVSWLGFSPDGGTIATGGIDRTIRLWDAHRGSGSILWEADDWIEQLAWSPDGKYLAYNCYECGEPEFIRVSDNAYFPFSPHPHQNPYYFLDNKTLVVPEGFWEDGYAVNFIQIGDADPENTFSLPPFSAYCFALAPAQMLIATCDKDSWRISNVSDGSTMIEAPTHADIGELQTVRFSPDSRLVLASGVYGTGVWDTKTAALLQIYPYFYNGLEGDPPTYDFSPDGTLLAYYGGYDGIIYIYGVLNAAPPTPNP